jgi:hypothetical protein
MHIEHGGCETSTCCSVLCVVARASVLGDMYGVEGVIRQGLYLLGHPQLDCGRSVNRNRGVAVRHEAVTRRPFSQSPVGPNVEEIIH